MIELTKGQGIGKKETIKWWNSSTKKQVWEIAGIAGSGKSTLVKILIDEMGLQEEEVAYATYTGKAALVLTLKGCRACTVHKLIYNLEVGKVEVKDNDGNVLTDEEGNTLYKEELSFFKKESLSSNIKLIVIDECSMINQETYDDLLSFGIPIIVLGDLYQLPPILGEPVLLKNPDVILTEIMRQKEGDPIVYLANRARLGQRIEYGAYGKSHVFPRRDMDMDMDYGLDNCDRIFTNADIVLCRTNKSRDKLNTHIRENIFDIHKTLPTLNDKLICRRNNWELALKDEFDINLVNGLIGYVNSPITTENIDMKTSSFNFDFKPEMCIEDFFYDIPASTLPFVEMDESAKKKCQSIQYRAFEKRKVKCNLFEFAYAITVHLSQGSSWKRVLIYDEHYGSDYNKALYTAITRAEKQVLIGK